MNITKIEIPVEISETLEATQLELNSVQNLIGFAMSTQEYNIPAEKIESLRKEYTELFAKYNLLKQDVEKNYVPVEKNKPSTSWSLDFATHTLTITENE